MIWATIFCSYTPILRQNLVNDIPRHIRQSEVTPLEAEGKTEMVEAEQMENGRVKIVNVDDVFDAVIADVVRPAERNAGLHAPAGEPHREAFDVVIAADHFSRLPLWCPAEFAP